MFNLDDTVPVKNCRVTLNSGYSFPLINFGTFRIVGQGNIDTVLDVALRAGYRGFDSAAVYGNEEQIGRALKRLLPKYNLNREDIFITTKLAPGNLGNESVVNVAVKRSLEKLQLGYIDLYLVHWPGTSGITSENENNYNARTETWKSLIKLHDSGKGPLKAIGVSNYTAKHLQQLLDDTGFPPSVNQVEYHPHWKNPPILEEICKKNRILLQAYSPLGGTGNYNILEELSIKKIAQKHRISPAQVILRWVLQKGYAIVPKSQTSSRIIENINLDEPLDQDDMKIINEINVERKYAWNPDSVF